MNRDLLKITGTITSTLIFIILLNSYGFPIAITCGWFLLFLVDIRYEVSNTYPVNCRKGGFGDNNK